MFAGLSLCGLVHLEQFGVKQQRVGSLCVVVTLFVEIAQLVQVPGRKQQRYIAYKMFTLFNVTPTEASFTLKLQQDTDQPRLNSAIIVTPIVFFLCPENFCKDVD